MGRKGMGNNWEAAELLELKANKFLYEVKENLNIYRLSIQINNNQVETLFHDVLEVEMEEVDAPEVMRGHVYIKKDGTGKYYALKNIYFYIVDFLEGIFNLTQTDQKYRLVIGVVFLIRIMQQLGVDLSEEQTAVYVALYQMTSRYTITDENIMEYIAQGLQEGEYYELGEKKMEKELSKLIEIGLVSIEEGRYAVTETLVFE